MRSHSVGVVDFPTLGHLLDGWYEAHCRVPDGFLRGEPFQQADWQFWCTSNFYRVRVDAEWIPERPLLNQAFVFRRGEVVGPQKLGKGPWIGSITAGEACGPTVFAGWAKRGDRYRCEDNGCPCGWSFVYNAGEPKGMRHPSPLIQLTGTSEEAVENNLWRHVDAMIRTGPLSELLARREGFVRILGQNDEPDLDRIDIVTASAQSRLGNPISFAAQDETGLFTKQNGLRKVAETQRRGAAGMGGRTLETTNAWDPAVNSVAQTTWESQAADVFRYYRNPDLIPELWDENGDPLDYRDPVARRKIHEYVYAGSDWVSLDSIEAEAAEIMENDPPQAERFFGNRLVQGSGAWLPRGLWGGAYAGAA